MKVITYRSRKLESNILAQIDGELVLMGTIPIASIEDDPEDAEIGLTREEKKIQKREQKKARQQKKSARSSKGVVVIGGEEISRKDFDPEEFDDLLAAEAMNRDGFYDMLHPIDEGEEKLYNLGVDKKTIITIIALGCLLMTVIIGGALALMYL